VSKNSGLQKQSSVQSQVGIASWSSAVRHCLAVSLSVAFVASVLGQQPQVPQTFPHNRSDEPANPTILAREQLADSLNRVAYKETSARAQRVAEIQTKSAALTRQQTARKRILDLIGGLPKERTPLHARSLGTWQGNGFRLERIIYESLPGFYVTANLYLPEGKGPFPAVISSPGHGATGKLGSYQFAGNFARNGIAVLVYDVLGQGERLQYPDSSGNSIVNQTIDEHAESGVQTMLLGQHISRYFVWDAMRSLDYLQSRPDIKAGSIGAYGCSGGGTVTAYFAALDERVKAAGVGCYLTSEQQLLVSHGPQDAEQSIPGFVASGLDFPDWVELFAPKPYAMISTTEDMFPFAGARTTYEESKRFYAAMGAEDHLHWITGPGRHGNLGPLMPEILAFFLQSLKGVPKTAPNPVIVPISAPPKEAQLCTRTGQVASSLSGETVFSINRKLADSLLAHRVLPSQAELRASVRSLTHASVMPKPSEASSFKDVHGTEDHHDHVVATLSIEEQGSTLPAVLSTPAAPGRHPVKLVLDSKPSEAMLSAYATADDVVLIVALRPSPTGGEPAHCVDSNGNSCTTMNPAYLGTLYLMSQRAMLVDRTLLGLRMDDVHTALDGLCRQPYADCSNLSATGSGDYGTALLFAALLDPRLAHITVERSLSSYRSVVDTQLHRDVSESILPGALLHFDLPDVVASLGKRVTIIDPIDADGTPAYPTHQAQLK
jgi:hypothetical protein